MEKAAAANAHLLHASEACLSGYAGADFTSFTDFDWEQLRWNTACLRDLAAALNLWLVLGSALSQAKGKPTNCLYLIDPQGAIVNRYDKSMCTGGDQQHYSANCRWSLRKSEASKWDWLFVTTFATRRCMQPIAKGR